MPRRHRHRERIVVERHRLALRPQGRIIVHGDDHIRFAGAQVVGKARVLHRQEAQLDVGMVLLEPGVQREQDPPRGVAQVPDAND